MNQQDVEYFGTLLNIEADRVKALDENGGLGDELKKLDLRTKEQVDKLTDNLTKEVRETHLDELTEQAKRGELDGDLYKTIKGAALQMTEKELAREYGVSEYDNLRDLVGKLVSNKSAKTDDKELSEAREKIVELQEANKKLVSEKEEAVTTAKRDYEGRLLGRELGDVLKGVPFDLSDVDDKDLEAVRTERAKALEDVFRSRYSMEYKDGQVVVRDSNGDPIKDEATREPVPVSDVMRKTANVLGFKLKSPESGGQGGKSSTSTSGKFKNPAAFDTWCEGQGLNPLGDKAQAILKERGGFETLE